MVSISKIILDYASLIKNDEHHRYRSWEHCYSYFQKSFNNLNNLDIDLAGLHLGFYLASWGMIRGSAFLLWKDYKIHKYIVKIIFEEKYSKLNNINPAEFITNNNHLDLLFNLKKEIYKAYIDNIQLVNGSKNYQLPSNTLITKILLGTLACTPAYDTYFINGMKKLSFNSTNFSRDSILEVSAFYKSNQEEFNDANREIEKFTSKYPPMKLIDMFFWQVGLPETRDNINDLKPLPAELKDDKFASSEKSVHQLMKEAINTLDDRFKRSELVNYIMSKNKNVNVETLRRNIYRVTVNRQLRVNWHPNKKARITDSEYDLLYEVTPEILEKYNPKKHNLWEIKEVNGKLKVGKKII